MGVKMLTLMVEPGTPLYDWVHDGSFRLLDQHQVLKETELLVSHFDSPGSCCNIYKNAPSVVRPAWWQMVDGSRRPSWKPLEAHGTTKIPTYSQANLLERGDIWWGARWGHALQVTHVDCRLLGSL